MTYGIKKKDALEHETRAKGINTNVSQLPIKNGYTTNVSDNGKSMSKKIIHAITQVTLRGAVEVKSGKN